ncbi:hypothetical protein Leryth_024621, partial [Lithospermum erythrorhizon]
EAGSRGVSTSRDIKINRESFKARELGKQVVPIRNVLMELTNSVTGATSLQSEMQTEATRMEGDFGGKENKKVADIGGNEGRDMKLKLGSWKDDYRFRELHEYRYR